MFDVRPGSKVWDKLPTRDGTFVVKLSVLSKAAHPDGTKRTNREVGIREGVSRGVKFRPLQVISTKGGKKLEVFDGNNRLAVARERGEKFVRIRLSKGVDDN
jgi:hypothetical protein